MLTRRCFEVFRCSVELFLAAKAGRFVSRGCGDDKRETISCGSRMIAFKTDLTYESRLVPPPFVLILFSPFTADLNQAGDENPTKRALTWRRNAQFWGLWGETVL